MKMNQSFLSKCASLLSLELRIASQNFIIDDLTLLKNLVIYNTLNYNLTLNNLPGLRVLEYMKQSIALKSGVCSIRISVSKGLHCI